MRPVSCDHSVVSSRPTVVFVFDIPARRGYPNGFSERVLSFINALGECWQVVAVPLATADGTGMIEPDALVAAVVPIAVAPREGGTPSRLARRIIDLTVRRLPAMSYPHRLPELRSIVDTYGAELVVLYGSTLAHLATDAPESVPLLCAVEEDWSVVTDLSRWTHGHGRLRRAVVRFLERPGVRTSYRHAGRRAQHVVVISDAERDRFSRFAPPARISVIPHAVDVSHFAPSGADDRDCDVVIVGDFRQLRTSDPAVRLWRASRSHRGNWSGRRWLFVGRGSDDLEIAGEPGVETTGEVPDVGPYYHRARVAVVPAEVGTGVKTTLLQAWAAAVPVVATPAAAAGTTAVHQANALIGDTSAALLDHADQLLSDEAMRAELGAAGQRAAEAFQSHDAAAAFTDVCRTTLDAG